MILLTSNSDLLQIVIGTAGSIKTHVSYVDSDLNADSYEPAAHTGTGTVTICPSPTGVKRNIKYSSVKNDHASVITTIEVNKTDGTVTVPLWEGTLGVSESIVVDSRGVWKLYGADGIPKAVGVLTELILAAVGAGAVPAAQTDQIKIFARKVAGRMTPKYIGPSGIDQVFQDKISENGQVLYLPNNGSTAGLNLGIGWTSGGTVSHPTPGSTAPAIYSQQKRTRWANVVTTTNQVLGLRSATAEKRFWRGNAAGLGGFNFHARFAIGLWPAATVRLFVGLNDSNSGWVISDTLTGNGCGLWHDTAEAASVLNFVTRDGTTATKAAITLAANLAAGQCFDFWMWCAPNGGVIGYKLNELNTGTTLVDTTTSTTIPLTTAFIGPELAMSNGTANITVTTTAFELAGHSIQSDN